MDNEEFLESSFDPTSENLPDTDSAIRIYLNDIGEIAILGPDNEFRLAVCIQGGRLVSSLPKINTAEAIRKMLSEKWAEFRNKLDAYNHSVETPLPEPDEKALIREASVRINSSCSSEKSDLYAYMNLAPTGQDMPWTGVCMPLFDAFLCIYILPPNAVKNCGSISEICETCGCIPAGMLKTRFAEVQTNAANAEQQFICANLKLVFSVAKKYQNYGISMEDLVQEGNLGLLHAVGKYDPRLGYRFSTYAIWWIRQAISRALSAQFRLIKLPAHTFEFLMKVSRVRNSLLQELGRQPTSEELALAVGAVSAEDAAVWNTAVKEGQEPPADVALRVREAARRLEDQMRQLEDPVSLEPPDSGDDDSSGDNSLPEDTTVLRPDDEAANSFLKEEIREVLNELPERERMVLVYRFGLDDSGEKTLDEISRIFGITRERVRQIELAALRHLRHPEVSGPLKEFFE